MNNESPKIKIEELCNKIRIKELLKKVEKLDQNDPDYSNKCEALVDQYIDSLEQILLNESMGFKVATIDFLSNINAKISVRLAGRKNPEIMKAFIAYESIKGFNATLIKKELSTLEGMTAMMYMGKIQEERGFEIIECENQTLRILNNYLQNVSDIDSLQNEALVDFYQNFTPVSDAIFSSVNNNFIPPRNSFVETLFRTETIDTSIISDIYNNVLSKHPILSKYNYHDIIYDNLDYLSQVKGFYKECDNELFDLLFSSIDENEELYNDYNSFFEEIVETNKDDKEGLKWFFKEVSKRIINNRSFKSYLETKDYFKEYANVNIEATYEENLNKFLNGRYDIDETIINDIGTYKGFINKFPELLKKFIESKDNNYKRKLILPLVVALIEKQKEKYHLDFRNVFTNKNTDTSVLGYYERNENVMYINTLIFDHITNLDQALTYSFDTIFHETRHACQYREIETSDEFNYGNLVMALDVILKTKSLPGYYETNYEHISYERDAREQAYVDCMTIFKDYPEIQKIVKESYVTGNYSMSDYLRKEVFMGTERYFGLVFQFLDTFNYSLKKNTDPKLKEYLIKEIKKYPVVLQFFELDEEKGKITIRNIDSLKELQNEAKKDPENPKNKQTLYSIKAFIYSLQIGQYLKSKDNYEDMNLKDDGYSELVIKEIEQNVGKGPTI